MPSMLNIFAQNPSIFRAFVEIIFEAVAKLEFLFRSGFRPVCFLVSFSLACRYEVREKSIIRSAVREEIGDKKISKAKFN